MMLRSLSLLAVFSLGAAGLAHGAGAPAKSAPAEERPPQELRVIGEDGSPAAEEPLTEVEAYCANIADPARDARYALKTERLKELEVQVEAKLDELEARRSDYLDWLAERKRFLEEASKVVVDIYSAMSPDAAAAQLARIDKPAAASVLVKLKSRQASDILSEMDPAIAAEIAGIIVAKTSAGATAKAADATAEEQS